MNILAIETSTDACSVALATADSVFNDHRVAPQQHAQLILPMISELLSNANLSPDQLNAVCYGTGPGSFTGLRIAAAAAQGIAYGLELPVVGVSSLHALAQGVYRETGAANVLAMFDARMGEVYWGAYRLGSGDLLEPCSADQVAPPEKVQPIEGETDNDAWVLAGSGAEKYRDSLVGALANKQTYSLITNRWPDAIDLLSVATPKVLCGETMPAADALPVYLRNKVALTEQERANGKRL